MAVLLECAACYQSFAVPQASSRRPAACPWCGAPAEVSQVVAAVASSAAAGARGQTSSPFPQLSPSRFPRRRRGTPAIVWMLVGVGLGACVVLAGLMMTMPQFFGRGNGQAVERQVKSADTQEAPNATPSRGSLATSSGSIEVQRQSNAQPRASAERQREIVRQVPRQALNRAAVELPRDPLEKTMPQSIRDRPPPIGDAADDSPALGLMLPERGHSRPARDGDRSSADAAEKKAAAARVKEEAAAVAALAAAGIRCEKDSFSDLVSQVDGSFRMTDDLLRHAGKLSGLENLKLSFSEVTDAGLAHVKDLTGLRELILNQTKVTDAGLAHLTRLAELQKLDLEKTLVSDESLKTLQALNRLEHLDIRGTKITPAGAESLRTSLSGAKIRH